MTREVAPMMVEALKKDANKTVRIFVVHALGDSLGDMVKVLRHADPADKATIYRHLRLRLTYHPSERRVVAEANPDQDSDVGKWVVSEGGLEPPRPMRALAPQASSSAIPPLGLQN